MMNMTDATSSGVVDCASSRPILVLGGIAGAHCAKLYVAKSGSTIFADSIVLCVPTVMIIPIGQGPKPRNASTGSNKASKLSIAIVAVSIM